MGARATLGQRFQAIEQAARVQALALPEHWQPPSRAHIADQRMGVALDGFMVHLCVEGWKEIKLGAVFDIAVRRARIPTRASGSRWPMR